MTWSIYFINLIGDSGTQYLGPRTWLPMYERLSYHLIQSTPTVPFTNPSKT